VVQRGFEGLALIYGERPHQLGRFGREKSGLTDQATSSIWIVREYSSFGWFAWPALVLPDGALAIKILAKVTALRDFAWEEARLIERPARSERDARDSEFSCCD
jgi:hypothetical protein